MAVDLPELGREFLERLREPLTRTVTLSGRAMTPTLNRGWQEGKRGEMLMLRSLPMPSVVSFAPGDVVAFRSPSDSSKTQVLRLAAVEGHEMVSCIPGEESFKLHRGECWVLADNDEISVQEANDSRTFGPLQMSKILGRVVYSARSPVDHSYVQNSGANTEEDCAVVECELDVEVMFAKEGRPEPVESVS
tara:strand:+ start:46 stop:618 length:573 start_codon:yes stop_codon:yes gene_type:complete